MIPMEDYKLNALEVVRALFSYGFKEAITWDYNEETKVACRHYYEWINDHRPLINELHIHLCSGESKVCILTENEDWVIKVGFQGKQYPCDSGVDYCAIEADFYKRAEEKHISQFFARTLSCGEVEGVEVFVQERVNPCEDIVNDCIYSYVSSQYPKEDFPDEESREESIASGVEYCDDDDIVRSVLSSYQVDWNDIERVVDFIMRYDINDLHSGNWGVTDDDRIVMIDYSGYGR